MRKHKRLSKQPPHQAVENPPSQEFRAPLIENHEQPPAPFIPTKPKQVALTMHEMTVLRYMSYGRRYRDIAMIMQISEQAAKSCAHKIFLKLNAENAVQAVSIAIRGKIIP